MSKMGELAEILGELKHCGEILIGISESLTELFSSPAPEGENPSKEAAASEPRETPPKVKPLALEDVRTVLSDRSRCGHTAEIRALLKKHGAEKLSEIDPAEYPALLAEVEAL